MDSAKTHPLSFAAPLASLIFFVLALECPAITQARKPAHPLLGSGRGIDHVGIGVRSLEKARLDYEQLLGFRCTENLPPISGLAALRSIVFFEDGTVLEFLAPPQPGPGVKSELAAWVEKHEGATSLCLETSSARYAAAYLEAHNFEVRISGWPKSSKEGQTKPPPVQYYPVSTPDTPTGNKLVFAVWVWLVEYVSPERPARFAARRAQGLMAHPNTSRRLHSVWFAVRNLDASLRSLRDAGLEPGEARESGFLGARGREVKAGQGSMLVLESVDEKSAVSKFLSNYDDGSIIAVSIEVSDLNKARSWVEGHSGHKMEPYNGYYGRSILIPPDLTHGVWLEFFQR